MSTGNRALCISQKHNVGKDNLDWSLAMCSSDFLFGGNAVLDKTAKLFGMDAKKAEIQAPPKQPVRQDAKSPDASATIDRVQNAQNSMSGGIANTLYTDPTGVDDENLRLGKKTLLGTGGS